MRIGITVLTDAIGNQFVYGGKGEVVLPLSDLPEHKDLVKLAATNGLVIGKKSFVAGMVVSQYGVESRKRFPIVEAKKK
jgi:hypothetical protein